MSTSLARRPGVASVLVLLLSATLLLAWTTPSQAVVRSATLSTKTTENLGHARMSADFEFISRTKVRVTGNVWDVCPADLNGAHFMLVVRVAGGGSQSRFAEDTDGCSNGGTAFSFTISESVRVTEISLNLYERTRDGRNYQSRTTGLIPNPR